MAKRWFKPSSAISPSASVSRRCCTSATKGLALLNHASQNFVSSLDLQQVLVAVLAEVGALFETASRRPSGWKKPPPANWFAGKASGPGSETMQGRRLAANRSLVGCTFSTGEAVLVHDVQLDTKYLPLEETPDGQALRSIVIVPFTAQSKVFGVLQIADGRARHSPRAIWSW